VGSITTPLELDGSLIMALRWFSVRLPGSDESIVAGFVGLIDQRVGRFKVYCGLGYGLDPDADTHRIALQGAKVDENLSRFLVARLPVFDGLEFAP
jgi:hypothetical protein